MKLVSISIILKLMQGFFAYLNIGFQSNTLTIDEFNYLSIIGNSIILSVFLDLGIGVQFIQNYFKQIKEKFVENEDKFALKYLALNLYIFVAIACIQAILISIYASIYLLNEIGKLNFKLITTTFCVTFIFSFGALVSRILVARGYVGESVSFQVIGVLIQFLFTVFAYQVNLDLIAFILTLAFPNIVTAVLSLALLKRRATLIGFDSSEEQSQRVLDRSLKNISLKLQILQSLQFTIGTLPILIISYRMHEVELLGILIQWRVFSSVSASLSSLNSIEWRASALDRNQNKQNSLKNDKDLIRKMIFAFGISIPTIFMANFTWDYLANGNQNTDSLTWLIWMFYVVAQVYQWHYYYKLLSIFSYTHLILGTCIQLSTTIICILVLNPRFLGSFPFSILMGLILSGLYMQIRSSSWLKINEKFIS
jgi:hypothetical protein